ncbi:MAG: hypothetical protein AB3N33_03165 [Puniceicoccaceae bacterium]
MIPSLFTFTILFALVLLVVGIPFLAFPEKIRERVLAFPRNRIAGVVLMLLGGAWFLWKIWMLGQSDFGDYKEILFALFAATLLGTIFYVQDFLAVRGLAVLVLLSGNVGLKSAFGLYDIPERLVLVSLIYLFVTISIFVGVMPYKMRDFLNWLYVSTARARAFGTVFVMMALALLVASFLY